MSRQQKPSTDNINQLIQSPILMNNTDNNIANCSISKPPETPLNDNKHNYRHKQNRLNSDLKVNQYHRHFSIHNSGNKLGHKLFGLGRPGIFRQSPSSNNDSINNGAAGLSNFLTPFKTTHNLFNQSNLKLENNSSNSNLLDQLRQWRLGAIQDKQYVTMDFVTEKICSYLLEQEDLGLVNSNSEWIEEFYQLLNGKFLMKQYYKVVDLFQNNAVVSKIVSHHLPSILIMGLSLYEMGQFEEVLEFIGDGEDDDEMSNYGSEHMFDLLSPPNKENARENEKIVISSPESRSAGNQLDSSICALRGKVLIKLNEFDVARVQLQKAVYLNVQNYESFQLLVDNSMLTKQNLLRFFNTLPFEQAVEDRQLRNLIKSLYYKKINYNDLKNGDFGEIYEETIMGNNEYPIDEDEEEVDVSFCDNDGKDIVKEQRTNSQMNDTKANMHIKESSLLLNRESQINCIKSLFTQCNYIECIRKCEVFISNGLDSYNDDVILYCVSSLFEINNKPKLFKIVNDLIMACPKEWITEFASGTHQLSLKKLTSARKHFAKATVLNPQSLASWIGYGHTFVADLEYEQAIVVYSTASKLFPGSHIPLMFLGMQYIVMENFSQSEQYLKMAMEINNTDPLLLNELGVIYYQQNDFSKAKRYFKKAYELVANIMDKDGNQNAVLQQPHAHLHNAAWNGIFVNLGHTYRKLNDLNKALMCFEIANENSMQNSNTLTSMALVSLKLLKLERCIDYLHKALSLSPENIMARNLLNKAMALNCAE